MSLTPDERADKIRGLFQDEFDVPDYLMPKIAAEIADAVREAVEEATAKYREEIETLIWNLAGCSTFALGYGLDEPWSKEKATPAMNDVHKLALKYREARAEAFAEGQAKACEEAAKIADDEALKWFRKEPIQAELAALRIRDALRSKAAEIASSDASKASIENGD